MANYYEKISVLIDVSTDKAVNGFKNFKTSVKEAEGFAGKLKAGVGSLKESVGGLVSGPAGMAAAGSAIAAAGAFAFDSAQKFIALARETENLATATGLTNEEASRLIEVFGDLGGDTASLQSALAKIPKTLDSGKWEEYGVATRDAGGNLKSTNDILLEGLQRLRDIKDPTARAKAGIDLFGKSWGTLAPLINQSDEALRDALATVSDAKVMDDKKIASAKKLAAAQDALVDAFDDFSLSVGQAVTEMGPLIEDMAQILDLGNQIAGFKVGGDSLLTWAVRLANPMGSLINEFGDLIDRTKTVRTETDAAAIGTKQLGQYMDFLRDRSAAAKAPVAELERKLANQRGGVAWAAKEAQTGIENMLNAISEDRKWIAVQLAMDDLKERLDALTKQYNDGEIDQREYWLRTRDEILATKGDLTDYLTTLEDMDPYLKQRILFEFDQGDIDTVLKLVQAYMDGKRVTIGTGIKTPVGMPWIGGGPKDQPYGTVNITVNGALDPVAVADQIEKIMKDQRYRDGQGGY